MMNALPPENAFVKERAYQSLQGDRSSVATSAGPPCQTVKSMSESGPMMEKADARNRDVSDVMG